MCSEEHRPVCGTDGKTYSNKCTMESLACEKNKTITVSYSGECKVTFTYTEGEIQKRINFRKILFYMISVMHCKRYFGLILVLPP